MLEKTSRGRTAKCGRFMDAVERLRRTSFDVDFRRLDDLLALASSPQMAPFFALLAKCPDGIVEFLLEKIIDEKTEAEFLPVRRAVNYKRRENVADARRAGRQLRALCPEDLSL